MTAPPIQIPPLTRDPLVCFVGVALSVADGDPKLLYRSELDSQGCGETRVPEVVHFEAFDFVIGFAMVPRLYGTRVSFPRNIPQYMCMSLPALGKPG